jgi:flagellar basal body P-ring protein FlgI
MIDVTIALASSSSQGLATVVITARVPPARQKGDTLEINASQFKVNPDATAEDLARKVPASALKTAR